MTTINNTNSTKTTKTTKKGGTSLITVITTIFIVLKLTGNISWSWGWVLAPVWIEIAFIVICVILAVIVSVTKK